MITLVVDTGFSYTKVRIVGTSAEFKFPSVVAVHKPSAIDLGDAQDIYDFDGKKYAVGANALMYDDKKYTRDIDYILDFSPLLVAHAMRLAGVADGTPCELIMGLPLKEFRGYREALIAKLREFSINGVQRQHTVKVHAQGVGVLADYLAHGAPEPGENGYIVDIGFNTVIVLHYLDGKARSDGSTQYDQSGVSVAIKDLILAIKKEHDVDLDMLDGNDILASGILKAGYGQKIDIRPLIEKTMENYLDSLLMRIENEFDKYLKRADRLIIAGGGAHLIKKHLPAKYQGFVYIPGNPEFANVRGFAKLG